MPLGGPVLDQPRSRVADDRDQEGWDAGAAWRPCRGHLGLSAARGFADTPLLAHLARGGWHWRLRSPGRCGSSREGRRCGTVPRLSWAPGQARFWPHVDLTTPWDGPVHLALGRPHARHADGLVVRAAPPEPKTCEASEVRVDSAEHGWDDHAHGGQFASSLRRSANPRERRCGVLARTTRSLVAQGTAVVNQGTRRWVDAPGVRGPSAPHIGGNWVTWALSRGDALGPRVPRSPVADPVPAMAANIRHHKAAERFSTLECPDAVAS